MIRIAQFISTEGIYGAERWIETLIKHLDSRFFSSITITIGKTKQHKLFHQYLKQLNFQAFHIDIGGKLHPKAVLSLRQLLMEKKIHILHTHGFKSDIIGYFATRKLPINLLSTPHGSSANEGFRISFYEAIGRFFLRRYNRIYPLSKEIYDYYLEKGFPPNILKLIYNAVDLSRFDSIFKERQIKKSSDDFKVLFVGRLIQSKGIIELVHAFAQTDFKGPSKLIIVGEGADRPFLETECERLGIVNRVEMKGYVEDVRPLYKDCDVLVNPSHSEGISRVIMEAFASGIPVIGTSIPGIRALVKDKMTGLIVQVKSKDSISEGLKTVEMNPSHAETWAMEARRLVENRFSPIAQARQYEDEFKSFTTSG